MARHYINKDQEKITEVTFLNEIGDEYTVTIDSGGQPHVMRISINNADFIRFLRKDIPNLIKLLEEAGRLL